MKKLLLGSTALVAAGLVAGPAAAQLEVSISGSVDFNLGLVSEKDVPTVPGVEDGNRGYGMTTDTTININVDGVADNGLEYGARINLDDVGILGIQPDFTAIEPRLFQTGLAVDEVYAFTTANWGQIRFGATDPAASELRFVMPTVGNGQSDGDFERYLVGRGNNAFGTDFLHSSDATKIVYLGNFADFTVGASFTPQDSPVVPAQAFYPGVLKEDGDLSEVFSLGGNWISEFNNVSVGVSAGYNYGTIEGVTPNPGGNLQEWGLGAEVGFGAFLIGGFYIDTDREDSLGLTDVDRTRWGLGASFTTGPWAFAINGMQGDDKATAADPTDGGKDTVYGAGLEYALAPGLTPYADIVAFDFDDNAGAGPAFDNDGTVFIAGLTVSF